MEAWRGQCQLETQPRTAPGGQLVRGSVSGGLEGPVPVSGQAHSAPGGHGGRVKQEALLHTLVLQDAAGYGREQVVG